MIDSALRTWLLSQATITGITSNVYPLRLPQSKFTETSIVYNLIDGFPGLNVGSVAQVSEATIQLDVYSPTYNQVRTLTNELITILNGYHGPLDILEASMIVVRNIGNTYEEDLKLYRSTIDINVHVK
tara:strand:- start:15498 stop:15881 length:384 start_codon:yes stop_codon:yes gene_type:complete